ncbi:putative uncharacterized protein [Bifidobacterium pseudocatenulatum CAG:263]|jgi:hypothetical protein|nr:putative uncharacterized protein [Bifidobacterium pseudocatenulatum CAG:263]
MKYDPKKLTYGDALRISTANMTVTVEVGGVQHVAGKLKHIDMDDALACDDPALRDLMALSLIITDNEYFVVRDDDKGILCPAIRFDRDLNVTWNTIISIEENPDDGVELDVSDWKATLVKVETPTADEEWEKQLPKANGFYKAATGSVWLHTGDTWTPILDHHGNVPPHALQQTTEAFAVSSGHSKRFPFERLSEKKLPTRPGFYRNKDKTNLYHLNSCGVWKLIAYMGPDFDLQMKDPWDSPLVPVFGGEVVSERRVRNDMPLHYCTLGLKQPKEAVCEANF